MGDAETADQVRRAVNQHDGAQLAVEQHVHVTSHQGIDGPTLTGFVTDGVAGELHMRLPLAVEPGVLLWYESERGAVDLRSVRTELPEPLLAVLPGLVQWDRTDTNADRAMHELVGQLLGGGCASDPALWLPAVVSLASEFVANPKAPGTLVARLPAQEWCQLIGLPRWGLADAVRRMLIGLGAWPSDPAVLHLMAGNEPGPAQSEAAVALAFDPDGAVQLVQVTIDFTAWLAEVHPAVSNSDDQNPIELAMWQTFGRQAAVVAAEPFPEDAHDVTRALSALTPRVPTPDPHATWSRTSMETVEGPVRVDPAMVDDLRDQSGAMYFVLRQADPARAETALAALAEALGQVRHPDEPSGRLASYIGSAVLTDDGGWLVADVSDMAEEDEVLAELVRVAASAANTHLTGGELSARRPSGVR